MKQKRFISVLVGLLALNLLFACAPETLQSERPTPTPVSVATPGSDSLNGLPKTPAPDSSPKKGVNKGDLAIDFSLRDLQGNQIKLSDFRGKVVLINFWVSTCHWCQKEAPLLEKLQQDYKDKGFVILKVNIKESKKTVEDFMEEFGAKSTLVLLDEKGLAAWFWYSRSRDLPGQPGTPTTFIVDKEGIIREVIAGFRDWDALENRIIIDNLLGEN